MVVNKIVNSENNIEDTYESYRQDAEYLLNRYCPLETKKVKKSKGPLWIDEEYKKARSERRKLERIWKKSKSVENRQRYVEQRNLCAQLALSKKERYYSKVIDSAENKQRLLLKVAGKLLDKRDERILVCTY